MEYWAHIQRKSSAKSQNENLTEAKGRYKFTDIFKPSVILLNSLFLERITCVVEKQMLEQPLSDKPTVMDLYRSDNN